MSHGVAESLLPAAVRRIPISVPSYGDAEIAEAMDSLVTRQVTMGEKVAAFERLWAKYVGVKHAVMTNSGSSANLLTLSALTGRRLVPGSEIITPALTWATTVFPIAQAGYVPVLVDVDRFTFNVSPRAIERAINRRTQAIMLVHLLGNPCEMDAIMGIARRHDLVVIEDSCEAHGAEWGGFRVGSFGDVATFSFHFSHHISTIEGGMAVTDEDEVADRLRAMRAFGWIRELPDRERVAGEYPNVDPRFLFLHAGYNFRPTEIQGAFGMHQVGRLEGFIAHRRELAAYWNHELGEYSQWLQLPVELPGTRRSYFTYPLLVREGAPFTSRALSAHLEKRGVETRPIEAGNMALQPAISEIEHLVFGDLVNATYIHNNAFFIGVHQGIGKAEREYVVECIHDFMRRTG